MIKYNASYIGKVYAEANEELKTPMPSVRLTQFRDLNDMTGGFRPREFTILCGATGVGKTTLCANLSLDLLMQGIPQFIASVETGHTDYVKRVMCALAQEDWNDGEKIHEDKLKKFYVEHSKHFETKNMILSKYDNRFSVEELMETIEYFVNNNGVKVAIVDNLNFFLEVTSSQNSVIEADRVTHELIIFCKRVDVHLIMIMHPKKTDHGRVESEFDIKGSSTAVQEAHNVFLFNRPSKDLIDSERAIFSDRELKLVKMRRRGKFVGRKLLLSSLNSVSYHEKGIV